MKGDKTTKRSIMGSDRRQREADNFYQNTQRPRRRPKKTEPPPENVQEGNGRELSE